MTRLWLLRSTGAVLLAVGLALAASARPSLPGSAVPLSVASTLRGGNCPNISGLTCAGSGIHGNGTTCPAGGLMVGCSQWPCNPTGNAYCCGISACWGCFSGWLTCVN